MTRKALPLLTALVFACLTHFAQGQTGQFTVYGEVTVDQLSGIKSSPVLQTLFPPPCTSGNVSTLQCTAYNNSVHPIGFTGGGTYSFAHLGPALLSIDLRGVIESNKRGAQTNSVGSGTRIYSGLGGLRASFKTPYKLLNPYVQGSAGYARSNYGVLTSAVSNGTSYSSNPNYPGIPMQGNLEFHIYAGLDLRLNPLIDFRLAELGYGALQSFGTYSHYYPMYSVSSGVVFHLPPRD